jgi:hypothetical protein
MEKSANKKACRRKGVLFDRVECINQSMNTAVVSDSEKKRMRLTDMFIYSKFTSNGSLILWACQKVRHPTFCKP